MRATDQQLKSMTNLGNHPDFIEFMKLIADWHKEEVRELIYCEKSKVAQGRTQTLYELLDMVEKARESASSRVSKRAIKSGPNNAF